MGDTERASQGGDEHHDNGHEARLESISITPAASSAALGLTIQLSVTGRYSDGSRKDLTNQVKYESKNKSIAIVSSSGLVTTKNKGTAVIKAEYQDKETRATITVTDPVLLGITVSPAAPSMPAGYTQQLSVTGSYSNGTTQELTTLSIYNSSDAVIATAASGGLITGISRGTATITVVYKDKYATITVTVNDPVLTGITVTPAAASIPAGMTQQIQVTGAYSNGTTRDLAASSIYSSSNTAVAGIEGSLIRGLSVGSTIVIVVNSGFSQVITISVTPPILTAISLAPASATIPAGLTQQLSVTGRYSDGSTADITASTTFNSSDTAIAGIEGSPSSGGVTEPRIQIRGITQGAAIITANNSGLSATSDITIIPPVLTAISINPATASIPAGLTQQYSVTGTYSDGSTQDITASSTFSSSDTAVSTVDINGLATGIIAGAAVITANNSGFMVTSDITITPPILTAISLAPASATIPAGLTQQLSVTGRYSDGSTADITASTTFNSSDTAVAGIEGSPSSGGVTEPRIQIRGITQGNATITATIDGFSATTNVIVIPPVLTGITITPASASIPAGLTQQYSVTGTYSDNSTQDVTASSTFSSSDTAMATVDINGLATGIVAGAAVITANNSGFMVTSDITVLPPVLTSISLAPASATIPAGLTQQLSVTGRYSDGSTADITASTTFNSSDTAVAGIEGSPSSGGVTEPRIQIRGITQGNATITAIIDGFSATTNVIVIPPVLTGITITPASASIPAGLTQQYRVTGTYSDGSTQDITASSTFSSSDTTIATVDINGLATGITAGAAVITANNSGFLIVSDITITPPVLTAISLAPASATIPAGLTQQLSVTGRYSDGSTADITASTTFSSSDTAVATVGINGLTTGLTVGAAIITVNNSGFNATTYIAVIPPVLLGIQVTPATVDIPVGQIQQLIVTGNYSDGSMRELTSVSDYVSSDTAVATVTPNGVVTGLIPGTAVITVVTGGYSISVNVTVPLMWPMGSSLSITNITGTECTLTWMPANPHPAVTDYGIYQNGARIATVPASALTYTISGLAPDTTYMFEIKAGNAATAWWDPAGNGPSATATTLTGVIVIAPDQYEPDDTPAQAALLALNTPQTHTIYPATEKDYVRFDAVTGEWYIIEVNSLSVGAGFYFELYYTDGVSGLGGGSSSESQNRPILWQAPATGVYYVMITHFDYYNGVGAYNVTAQPVTIPLSLSALILSPSDMSLYEYDTAWYYVEGTLATGGIIDLTQYCTFTVSDPAIATSVGLEGWQVQGIAAGTVTITATYGSISATATLTVSALPYRPDIYEPDGDWDNAKPIPTDGTVQTRTISPPGDNDNITIEAVAGIDYEICTVILAGGIQPYMTLYDNNFWWVAAGDGITGILRFTAQYTGRYNLSLYDQNNSMGEYSLSVQPVFVSLSATPTGNRILTGGSRQITVSGTGSNGATIDITNLSVISVVSGAGVVSIQNNLITALSPGYAILQVQAGANTTQIQVHVADTADGFIPPDPATIAPPLDMTVSTTLVDATSFVYAGSAPIQLGVAPGTITPVRVSLIRGKVSDINGNPLSGVLITILNHPEYGSTLSRTDGMYDMAVNGGSYLTVSYEKTGIISSHRQIDARWQEYGHVDDVILLGYDPVVTTIDLANTTTIQTAQGSVVTDADGTRRATTLFSPGTVATMTLPDGSTQPLTTLNIRATEYTVGPNGPKAMPAHLPPTSGYTYAVELSVDEAVAAGAGMVQFSQPVYTYIENFLSFPVGGIVPAGYYDRVDGCWIPSDNGRVIAILSITNGLADVDVDGTGIAADAAALAALAITDAERGQLALLYTAGQSLWRVPVAHFTPWDYNWPYGPPEDAKKPKPPKPGDPDKDCPDKKKGSVIEVENQILGERLPIAGTPLSLSYQSDRVSGRKIKTIIEIPLSDDTLPASVKSIELIVEIAGQTFKQTFPALPNQSYSYIWDGKDGYGRSVYGNHTTRIKIGYVYGVIYYEPAAWTQSFSRLTSSYTATGWRSGANGTITLWEDYRTPLEVNFPNAIGSKGWNLSPHHIYDIVDSTLYMGNGTRRSAKGSLATVSYITGNDYHYSAVTLAPDGGLYLSDDWDDFVKYLGKSSSKTLLTDIIPGYYSPYIQPNLYANNPRGMAVDSVGNLYVALAELTSLIVKIDTTKDVRTGSTTIFAGRNNGNYLSNEGYGGDDGLATQALLFAPSDVAIGVDDEVYIADTRNHRIRRVDDCDGIITTLVGNPIIDAWGNQIGGYGGDGGSALQAQLNNPKGITFDKYGNLYIADTDNHRIRKVTTDGIITTIAGDGTAGFLGDGGDAIFAQLNSPNDVAIDSHGNIYIADNGNQRVRMITVNGIIITVAGGGTLYPNENLNSLEIMLSDRIRIDLDKQDNLIIADRGYHRVLKIQSPFSGFSGGEFAVSSTDGSELYKFNASGKHLSTINTRTGAVIYDFVYDNSGLLISITDYAGNITTIERDNSGNATAITAPGGQRTILTIDAAGYLTALTNPANESYNVTYTPDHSTAQGTLGLLATISDPKGNTSMMTYDSMGRLIRDENAAGGYSAISRTENLNGYTVILATATGRTDTYTEETLSTGVERSIHTNPGGFSTVTVRNPDGTTTVSYPDGMATTSKKGADPRWGMQAPIISSSSVTTPSGLMSTTTATRTVSLSDPNNVLSLLSQTDIVTVNGRVYTTSYDSVAMQATASSPSGRQSITTFDSAGRIATQQVSGLEMVVYAYDTIGRLESISQGTRLTTFGYNTLNQLVSVTDSAGRVSSYAYDLAGRVTSQTLPDGRIITSTYDANGNLTSLTPPGRPAHGFDYTMINQESGYNPPDVSAGTGTTTYEYNLDKELIKINRPDGQAISLSYIACGKPSAITLPNRTITYGYDTANCNLMYISSGGMGSISYTYDGSLITSQSWGGSVSGSVEYVYDNDFRIVSTTVNGIDPIAYNYDGDSMLSNAGALSIIYDAANGLLTGTTLDTITTANTYSNYGEIAGFNADVSGTSLYNTSYVRDNLGRIMQKIETISGVADIYDYAYDVAGRLVSVSKNGSVISSYSYDDNGNRLNNGSVYDNQDRLISNINTTYQYTTNGELLSKTDINGITQYNYDVLGNLISVTLPDSTLIEYIIDGQNRRIGKKVNGVLVQGLLYTSQLNPIVELDGSGNVISRFIYGSKANVPDYMIKNGINYRIISDHLGSPRMVVDSVTGVVAQQIAYDEFGNVLSDTNPGFQPFGFAGGLYDQHTKLVRFGARDYDAEIGRWTCKDPIRFNGGDTNLYGYVVGDPVNRLDTNGLTGTYGQIGGQGTMHFGFIGTSVSVGLMPSPNGWKCGYITVCGRFGPGFFAGGGGAVGGGIYSGDPDALGGWSFGPGFDMGFGEAVGGQATLGLGDTDINSAGATTGKFGLGGGFSFGVDVCYTFYKCKPDSPNPKQCKTK